MVKRHLNTLFVTTQGAYLAKEGEAVLVKIEKERKLKLPLLTLDGIICFGNVSASPFLLGACGEAGLTVSFLTERGRFLYRSVGTVSGNVLLRRQQYRLADSDEASAAIATNIVTGKIANSRYVLQRFLRDHRSEENEHRLVKDAVRTLGMAIKQLANSDGISLDFIRGIEGDSSRCYFQVFNHLITAQKDFFQFHGRNRRPPLDPVNAMLSFCYMLLMHDIRSALEAVGLDPAVGFLHRDRPGRMSLALDMMEEFRSILVDRFVLSLINRRQVSPGGFETTGSGAVSMDDETRKTILVNWQKRKQEELNHPFLNEKVSIGLLPHIQARLMSRYIRGDLDGYPPFLSR